MRTRRPARQSSSCDGPSEPTTVTSSPPRVGNHAGSALAAGSKGPCLLMSGPGLLMPSTATLNDTPAEAGDASERRTPSTIAKASSSSGSTRRPAAARARSVRARSSNAIAQRRTPRLLPRIGREQRSPCGKSQGDGCGHHPGPRRPSMPRRIPTHQLRAARMRTEGPFQEGGIQPQRPRAGRGLEGRPPRARPRTLQTSGRIAHHRRREGHEDAKSFRSNDLRVLRVVRAFVTGGRW